VRRRHAQYRQLVRLPLQRVARRHHRAQFIEVGGHLDTASTLDLAVVLPFQADSRNSKASHAQPNQVHLPRLLLLLLVHVAQIQLRIHTLVHDSASFFSSL
jgi:hypothetical protein